MKDMVKCMYFNKPSFAFINIEEPSNILIIYNQIPWRGHGQLNPLMLT